jgi:hypothetical protein
MANAFNETSKQLPAFSCLAMKSWCTAPIAIIAWRMEGAAKLAWGTRFSQKSGEKHPDNLGAVTVLKKKYVFLSIGSSFALRESDLESDFFCPGLVSDIGAYPSHLRPVEVHLLQNGFSSPHLTLRILLDVSQLKGVRVRNARCCYVLASDASCSDRSTTYSISMSGFGLHGGQMESLDGELGWGTWVGNLDEPHEEEGASWPS